MTKQILLKFVALLCIVGLIYSQPASPIDFDTAANSYTTQIAAGSFDHPFEVAWTTAASISTAVRIKRSHIVGNTLETTNLQITATNTDLAIKAISKSTTCAVVHRKTSGTTFVNAYNFPASGTTAPTAIVVAAHGTTALFADLAVDITAPMSVSDNCNALRIGAKAYRYVSAPPYVEQTVSAAWTDPVFNADFSIAVGDNGIYTWAAGSPGVWTKNANTQTFFTNKIVHSASTDRLVVFSWKDNGTTAANKDYKLQVFKITTTTTFTLVTSVTGISIGATPKFTLSDTLQTLIITNPLSGSTFSVEGRIINYTPATATVSTIQIPDALKAASFNVYVNNNYLVAQRTTTPYPHLTYFINGNKLMPYAASFDSAFTTGNYVRLLVKNSPKNKLQLWSQRMDSTTYKVIYSQLAPTLEIFQWNSAAVATGGFTPAIQQVGREARWFGFGTITSGPSKTAIRASLTPPNTAAIVSLALANAYTLVATSMAKSAIIVKDAAKVQVYHIEATNDPAVLKDITSLISVAASATATFDVSNTGVGLRINTAIYRLDAGTYDLQSVLPAATTFPNPAFTPTWDYMIADNGIFKYTPKVNSTPLGRYTLERNDTFYTTKQVYKDGNNMVIFSYAVSNGSIFNWKIQYNWRGPTGEMRKIDQVTGTSFNAPKLAISPKLSVTVVHGYLTSATTYLYSARIVDWISLNKTVRVITLPSDVTSVQNALLASDEFLIARNLVADGTTGLRRYYGYALQGPTVINIFNDPMNPNFFRTQLTDVILLPDPSNLGRIVLGLVFLQPNGVYRIIRDQKKSPGDIIFANKPKPFELQLRWTPRTGTTLQKSIVPFGRYIYVHDTTGFIQYVEYRPTVPSTKRVNVTSTATIATTSQIKASSPSKDCIITSSSTGTLIDIYQVNLTASPPVITKVDSLLTLLNTDFTNFAGANANTVTWAVADGCQRFRANNFLYVRNAAASATPFFAKESTGSALSSALYDPTLKWAYVGGVIHKWSGTAYVSTITGITGLQTTVQLFVSGDDKKVLLFSNQVATGATHNYVVKLYVFGSAWAEVVLPTLTHAVSGVTVDGAPKVILSRDFQTIGLHYQGGATGALLAKAFAVRLIYTNTTSTYQNITVPAQWLTATYDSSPSIIAGNDILYYRSNRADATNGVTGIRQQRIYTIDKVNFTLKQLNKKRLTAPQVADYGNANIALSSILVQQPNRLSLLTQRQQISQKIITILRKQLGSAGNQTVLNRIDGNVVIVDGVVRRCIPGCKDCNDPQNCVGCADTFVLDSNNKCVRCIPGCAVCTLGATTCVTCLPGRQGSSCASCDSTCLTCSGSASGDCVKCKNGFYRTAPNSANSACSACISNCNVCTTGTDCTVCVKGFVYSAGVCLACPPGCAKCKADKLWQCDTSCPQGFEPRTANVSGVVSNVGCTPCPLFCTACANQTCTACRTGMILDAGKCIPRCRAPCLTCNAGFPTQCTACLGGYILNSTNFCNEDLSCNTASNCTVCPNRYNLVNSQCLLCQGGTNCQQCLSTSTTTCLNCARGYYQTSTATCMQCISGCAQCDDELSCNQCSNGFTLTSADASPAKCTACDQSCSTCWGNPRACDLCAPGYVRSGSRCIGENKVNCKIKIDVGIDTLTNTNAMAILRRLSQASGRPESACAIQSIVAGSVVVDATVSVASSASVASTSASLAQVLANGATIDGLSVIDSSFTAVSSSGTSTVLGSTKQDEHKNIAIIVGVVIPIALIIIFIIIIILMKKGVICVDSAPGKVRDVSMDHIDVNQKESEYNTMRKK